VSSGLVVDLLSLGWYGAPIKLIWLSTSFLLLGGGVRVYLSMLFSMITDLVHPDLRFARFFVRILGTV